MTPTGFLQLALIVAQTRDKANNLSGILLSALEEGLRKISRVAKGMRGTLNLVVAGGGIHGGMWSGARSSHQKSENKSQLGKTYFRQESFLISKIYVYIPFGPK